MRGSWPDSSLVGSTFEIHSSQLDHDGGECGNSSWKGVVDSEDSNSCTALPCAWDVTTGSQVGQVRARVAGYPGCDTTLVVGCHMVVGVDV